MADLLVSLDYRPDAGGISRVARLMGEALGASTVYSLYGPPGATPEVTYCGGSRPRLVAAVLKFLLRHRPDRLVFDHLGVASLLALWPGRPARQTVVFLHDEEAWKPVSGRHRAALRKADLLLCNSTHTHERFVAHNPAFADKAQVCLLGGVPAAFRASVPPPAHALTAQHGEWLAKTCPYLIFVSRLWEKHTYKGYWPLLMAFQAVVQEQPDFPLRLAVVGRGDVAPALRAYIGREGLSGHVRHFDDVSDAALYHFYDRSAGLLFPSNREGFGFVFLEAMYFGKPCVGLREQPAEDIVVDGQTGRLLADQRAETLAVALRDWAARPEAYARMGTAGRARYDAHFTHAHFQRRFLDALS